MLTCASVNHRTALNLPRTPPCSLLDAASPWPWTNVCRNTETEPKQCADSVYFVASLLCHAVFFNFGSDLLGKRRRGGERGFKFPSWQWWAVRLLCLRALHLPFAEEHRFSGKHPPAVARGDRAEPWAQSPCAQGPSHHLCRGAAAARPSPQQA